MQPLFLKKGMYMEKEIINLFDLSGRTAVVTGGTSLLGLKITEALLEAGAFVYVTTSRDDLESVKASVPNYHDRLEVVHFQMKDPDRKPQLESVRDKVIADHKSIDIFVSNAVVRTGADATDEEIAEQINANTMGLINSVEVFGEQMCRQNHGSIIIISSNSASQGPDPSNYVGTSIPGYLPGYNISKAACTSFMRFSASKYGSFGVRCNSISPIAVHSPKTDKVFENNYAERTLLGRICYPDDIKGLTVFLASDASSFITGVDVPLDGGHASI